MIIANCVTTFSRVIANSSPLPVTPFSGTAGAYCSPRVLLAAKIIYDAWMSFDLWLIYDLIFGVLFSLWPVVAVFYVNPTVFDVETTFAVYGLVGAWLIGFCCSLTGSDDGITDVLPPKSSINSCSN